MNGEQSIDPTFWWSHYSKAFFILSNTFRPGVDFTVEQSSYAMQCFYISVSNLLPNRQFKLFIQDFIQMKPNVYSVLNKAIPKFWQIYPSYHRAIQEYPQNFFVMCTKTNESMFIWTYLLQTYIFQSFNEMGHKVSLPTLNEMKDLYNPELLSKYDWGPPLWFIIHFSALHAPEPVERSFSDYKSMLGCLQYLLPCAKCRNHLATNLTNINIETCAKTREEMFRCSWELHNIVNKDTKKPFMPFDQAIKLYIPPIYK